MAKIEPTQPVPRAQVVLTSEEEVQFFIKDIRRCLKDSKRSGGRYCTGIKTTDGECIICVWVPAVPRTRRKR